MGAEKHVEAEWSKWYAVPEGGRLRIKRYRKVAGVVKWQRYPASRYRDVPDDQMELVLRRLNASYEADRLAAVERYNFDHAFVNVSSLDRFQKHVQRDSRMPDHGPSVITLLNQYVFKFFILQEQLADPSTWHRKEAEYGEWLLAQELSAGRIKRIVSTANRFTKFLVEKVYPNMTTPRKLEPIGRVVLADMGSEAGKYIKPETFEKMRVHVEKVRPDVLPHFLLCYAFGLRIGETQGLTKAKFLKDALLVDEQGDHVEDGEIVRRPSKTAARRVPYWNMSAKEAWQLVKQMEPMHPDTLKKRVNACMAKFGHTSHDFRRRFISSELRKRHWKDVQKSVGHTDVRTTMGYDQDDRDLNNELADLD